MYAPVIDFSTVSVEVSLAMGRRFIIHQLDVKTSFLNCRLIKSDNIYIHLPDGLDIGVPYEHVLRLNGALYGLKLAP